MTITKRTLRDALGTNDAGLAKFFDVTPSAVSQWPEDSPLPTMRRWQVLVLRPDIAQMESTVAAVADLGPLVDTRMSKRALRARLGLSSDAHLAKVLKLPAEQVEAWPEEQSVPPLPQVLQLLGVQEVPAAVAAPDDPDANRIDLEVHAA